MIFIIAWPMDLGSVCMNSQVINFLVSLPFALSVVRYLADVRTGQLKEAETEAEVSLCLCGTLCLRGKTLV